MRVFNEDQNVRRVLVQLIDGTYSPDDPDLFRPLYDSLLNKHGNDRADRYFILADFESYVAAQRDVETAYNDPKRWARMAMMNVANVGKFSSDRTIEEYAQEIWHLEKVFIPARRGRKPKTDK
jgi:starch phosphorylase